MKRQWYIDVSVGFFVLCSAVALFILAIKISGLSQSVDRKNAYMVTAEFSDIGGLRVHAPVTIAGVRVGEVIKISLQPQALNARVTMLLDKDKRIPSEDTSARILTQGLLGSNYISIVPGFEGSKEHPYLQAGDSIAKTQEAVILENVIGQLVFNINKK